MGHQTMARRARVLTAVFVAAALLSTAAPVSAEDGDPDTGRLAEDPLYEAIGLVESTLEISTPELGGVGAIARPVGETAEELLSSASDPHTWVWQTVDVTQDQAADTMRDLGIEYPDVGAYVDGLTVAATKLGFISYQDCRNEPKSYQENGWVPNRLYWCGVYNFGFIQTEKSCSLCPTRTVGTASWRHTVIGKANETGGRRITFTSFMDNWQVDGRGNEISVTVNLPCSNALGRACDKGSVSNSYTQTIGQWRTSNGSRAYEYVSPLTNAAGQEKFAIGNFNMSVTGTWSGATATVAGPGNSFRCDSATYIGSSGCIYPGVYDIFELSKSDPAVDESAKHIEDAQLRPEQTLPLKLGKQVPGSVESGTTLRRLYHDKARRDRNRDTARATCRQQNPLYSTLGQDCDEYPFSSTYQGAWSADGNYSARPILASDNQTAGVRLGQFYKTKRIADDVDRFHVRITP